MESPRTITPSEDRTVKLWNMQGQLIHTLDGYTKSFNQIVFSPDGRTIASAGEDETVKLWNFNLDNVMNRGCDLVQDYLTNNPNVSPEDRKICDAFYSNPIKYSNSHIDEVENF